MFPFVAFTAIGCSASALDKGLDGEYLSALGSSVLRGINALLLLYYRNDIRLECDAYDAVKKGALE